MPYQSPFPKFEIPDIDFVSFVFENIEEFKDLVYLEEEWSGRVYTFSEVKDLTGKVASALKHRGIKKGDVIFLNATTCLENCPLLFGSVAAGATVNLLHPFARADALALHTANCSPKYIITSSDRVETWKSIVSKTDVKIGNIFVTDMDQVKQTTSLESSLYQSANELLSGKDFPPIDPIVFDTANDVPILALSGGTTGFSKTVMNTHRSLVAGLISLDTTMGDNSWLKGQCFLGHIPINLIFGLASMYCLGLRHGARILLMRSFDLEFIMKQASEQRVRALHLIPPQIVFLAHSDLIDKLDLSCWVKAYCGGAPVDDVHHKQLEDRMRLQCPSFQIVQGYGLTEFSGGVAGPPTKDQNAENKPGSVGMLVAGVEAKLIDLRSGEEIIAPDISGELFLSGPQLMAGYYKRPDMTAEAIRDGWFRTGDVGKFDAEEFLYITDRVVDLIHCRQDIIFPSKIERVLHTHPSVSDCAVVGRKDGKEEELPVAFVVLSSETSVSDIIRFANSQLSVVEQLHKDRMRVIDRIPRNPSKVMRNALRQRLLQK